MKNQIHRIGLTTLILILFIPIFARDFEDFEYTYQGQTLTYTILSEVDKTVRTKSGSGQLYSPGNVVSGKLIIPEVVEYKSAAYKVVEIGSHAFDSCRDLAEVIIPNSVISIEFDAFYH